MLWLCLDPSCVLPSWRVKGLDPRVTNSPHPTPCEAVQACPLSSLYISSFADNHLPGVWWHFFLVLYVCRRRTMFSMKEEEVEWCWRGSLQNDHHIFYDSVLEYVRCWHLSWLERVKVPRLVFPAFLKIDYFMQNYFIPLTFKCMY